MSLGLPYGLLPSLFPSPLTTGFPVPTLVSTEKANFESFNLASIAMPGQWLLVECTREFGWEQRKGYALTGATLVPVGDNLLTAKFAIKIWTSTDANFFRSLLKTVLKKPAGLLPGVPTTAGMGIDQPQLVDLGVKTVVVKSVSALLNPLVTSGGKGPWTATCTFWEYRKPIAAIATPTTVYPDKALPTPSAADNIDTENARMAAQLAAKTQALAAQAVK